MPKTIITKSLNHICYSMNEFKCGLLPVAGIEPVILILGSFPGIMSLEKNEYYGNPNNHFWKIIEAVFGINHYFSYDEKIQNLKSKGIALWDSASECRRKGSSDSTMTDIIPNDIASFLKNNRTIRVVALNGITGAGKIFKKQNPDFDNLFPDVTVITLPSSSAANAKISHEQKIQKWKVLNNYLLE